MFTASCLPLIRTPSECAQSLESEQQRYVPSTAMSISLGQTQYCRVHISPNYTPIHILDDDSLLNIFYLYRPLVWDKDWTPGRFKLAHVCRRW